LELVRNVALRGFRVRWWRRAHVVSSEFYVMALAPCGSLADLVGRCPYAYAAALGNGMTYRISVHDREMLDLDKRPAVLQGAPGPPPLDPSLAASNPSFASHSLRMSARPSFSHRPSPVSSLSSAAKRRASLLRSSPSPIVSSSPHLITTPIDLVKPSLQVSAFFHR
jgi:hypothetical protein